MKGQSDGLSPLERDFLKASQNVKRQERLRWVELSGIGVLLLLAVVLAQMGYFNRLMYRPVDMEGYWVTIPAGEFQIGSENGEGDEKPVHLVFVDEFQIGKFEVTNRQYAQCVKANICRSVSNAGAEMELHPVVNVSWFDAQKYCEWVGGRLPTEAEWEKAASWDDQAKTKRTYPWGETIDCTYANYFGKNGGSDFCVGDTMPVGNYESGKSPYGLYDMAGNVWEWVNDWYSGTYYQSSPSSNPLGPDPGQYRVLRGGSWYDDLNGVRSADRYGNSPAYTSGDLFGFRCSRSP
jgi:formylglycine-generating enzyme required for sulfatase activity